MPIAAGWGSWWCVFAFMLRSAGPWLASLAKSCTSLFIGFKMLTFSLLFMRGVLSFNWTVFNSFVNFCKCFMCNFPVWIQLVWNREILPVQTLMCYLIARHYIKISKHNPLKFSYKCETRTEYIMLLTKYLSFSFFPSFFFKWSDIEFVFDIW